LQYLANAGRGNNGIGRSGIHEEMD
jgi:hypothetical protein